MVTRDPGAMRALNGELMRIQGFRRRQGCKQTVACVPCVHIHAELANMRGCLATAQFAKALSQAELAAVCTWRNRRTGLCEPHFRASIHRVVRMIVPEALEDVVGRHCAPGIPLARARATEGRNGRDRLA